MTTWALDPSGGNRWRDTLKPWRGEGGGMGRHHLRVRSCDASKGGGCAGPGDASIFRLATPPPPESEYREDARADDWGAVLSVTATISGYRRRELADSEQRVALRPIRTKSELTTRCIPRAPQRAVSTKEGARYQANCLPGLRELLKPYTASLAELWGRPLPSRRMLQAIASLIITVTIKKGLHLIHMCIDTVECRYLCEIKINIVSYTTAFEQKVIWQKYPLD